MARRDIGVTSAGKQCAPPHFIIAEVKAKSEIISLKSRPHQESHDCCNSQAPASQIYKQSKHNATIPGKDSWIVILGKKAKQFGAFEYSKADDQVRVTVTPAKEVDLVWDHTRVPIAIHTEK